jgi:hypothetical protein
MMVSFRNRFPPNSSLMMLHGEARLSAACAHIIVQTLAHAVHMSCPYCCWHTKCSGAYTFSFLHDSYTTHQRKKANSSNALCAPLAEEDGKHSSRSSGTCKSRNIEQSIGHESLQYVCGYTNSLEYECIRCMGAGR